VGCLVGVWEGGENASRGEDVVHVSLGLFFGSKTSALACGFEGLHVPLFILLVSPSPPFLPSPPRGPWSSVPSKKGLKVWVFTTEQGTFETDEDRVIRIKYYQQYGFGQYPNSLVFDKIDIVGKRADPFYKFLCKTLRNPNKIARITLNFEKFLLDANGRPVRRYPRRYTAYDMEEDVKAVLAGEPLPPPSPKLIKAWRDAYVEAERSEYAFKKGLNYYEPLGEDQRSLP